MSGVKFELTQEQKELLDQLNQFVQSDHKVFILKGYAGTGKTTIIRNFIDSLSRSYTQYILLAPTGRAAKVLSDVSGGQAQTIHRCIYSLKSILHLKGTPESEKDESVRFAFPLRPIGDGKNILIVDEASMISSRQSIQELYRFGSGILLDDLLVFAKIHDSNYHNKIVFVGDPAQLPPVGDNTSRALSKEYFEGLGVKAIEYTLTKVLRQKEEGATILRNATTIRDLLGSNVRNKLVLEYDQQSFIPLNAVEIAQSYIDRFPTPQLEQSAVIAYSNKQCQFYNQEIRKLLFPDATHLCPGDILIVVKNNYSQNGADFMNGEMIKVVSVDDRIEEMKVPLRRKGGDLEIIPLTFRRISFLTKYSDEIHSRFIIDSLLHSEQGTLSKDEFIALYVGTKIKFQELHESKTVDSEEFMEYLRQDPFYNALHVKFGYAITTHKSQGGEWDTVFVDYSRRNGVTNDQLRWSYTATTRARACCFAINAPHLSICSQLSISPITKINSLPVHDQPVPTTATSPHHTESDSPFKSQKYWEVVDRLKGSGWIVSKVQSLSQYQERYTLTTHDARSSISLDTWMKKHGVFRPFAYVRGDRAESQNLLELLNKPREVTITLDYQPTLEVTSFVYELMQSVCAESSFQILHIEEYIPHSYFQYELQGSQSSAVLLFYFDKNRRLTKVVPKSTISMEDAELQSLLKKIEERCQLKV